MQWPNATQLGAWAGTLLIVVATVTACGGSDKKDSAARGSQASATSASGQFPAPPPGAPGAPAGPNTISFGSPGGTAGTVARIEDDTLTLSGMPGGAADTIITLTPSTTYTRMDPAQAADVEAGATVTASGFTDQNGTIQALGLTIGPADGAPAMPGSSTGTVERVDGNRVTLRTATGTATAILLPETQITRIAIATRAELQPGQFVSVTEDAAAGSNRQARAVSILPPPRALGGPIVITGTPGR